jgi:protein-L-isoaspartate(D-aspartate) O-methyltransferase
MNSLNLPNDNSFKERRNYLINHLRRRGISEKVLNAMEKLAREKFVGSGLLNRAYDDTALPIACNQTISQPYTVAFMTDKLDVNEGDKILEIGTGSGYQAALLALMGARVFTIERIPELYTQATELFREWGLKINTRLSDGSLGWREFAPYDRIIVTAAAPSIPKPLLEQLKIGGKMVIPIGDLSTQDMFVITKTGENEYEEDITRSFKFVPLIGKQGWEQ